MLFDYDLVEALVRPERTTRRAYSSNVTAQLWPLASSADSLCDVEAESGGNQVKMVSISATPFFVFFVIFVFEKLR